MKKEIKHSHIHSHSFLNFFYKAFVFSDFVQYIHKAEEEQSRFYSWNKLLSKKILLFSQSNSIKVKEIVGLSYATT